MPTRFKKRKTLTSRGHKHVGWTIRLHGKKRRVVNVYRTKTKKRVFSNGKSANKHTLYKTKKSAFAASGNHTTTGKQTGRSSRSHYHRKKGTHSIKSRYRKKKTTKKKPKKKTTKKKPKKKTTKKKPKKKTTKKKKK
jgi:hypothetical protein